MTTTAVAPEAAAGTWLHCWFAAWARTSTDLLVRKGKEPLSTVILLLSAKHSQELKSTDDWLRPRKSK